MLSLRFKSGGYAFVYHRGVPIGAILVGQTSPSRSLVSLLFSGNTQEFEVLRSEVVARRYGEDELDRLIDTFALWIPQSQQSASAASPPVPGRCTLK